MNDTAKIEKKYIQFPLCMLQKLAIEPQKTINSIISYGFIYFAKRQKYDLPNVARQVYYDWVHDKVDGELFECLEELENTENLTKDLDYKGFVFDGFDSDEIGNLKSLLEKYPKVSELAIEHYQLHTACEFFDFPKLHKLNLENIIKQSNEVEDFKNLHESKFGKQPLPSISLEMLNSFYANPDNIELFLAYIAVKSLQGQKKFTATNKDAVIMRMIGAKSKEALAETLKNKALKELYNKYINRYWADKLLNELFIKGFIKSKVGYKRKIYLSTSLDSIELAKEVADFLKTKNAKSQEKETRNLIEQHLYNASSI